MTISTIYDNFSQLLGILTIWTIVDNLLQFWYSFFYKFWFYLQFYNDDNFNIFGLFCLFWLILAMFHVNWPRMKMWQVHTLEDRRKVKHVYLLLPMHWQICPNRHSCVFLILKSMLTYITNRCLSSLYCYILKYSDYHWQSCVFLFLRIMLTCITHGRLWTAIS